MQTTRRLAVRPRLRLAVDPLSTFQGLMTVQNLGPGTACDVKLTLTFEPHGATRSWTSPFLASGEKAQFRPIGRDGSKEYKLQTLADDGLIVRVRGTMLDVQGDRHDFTDEVNLAEWWDMALRSDRRYVDDIGERIVKELHKIGEALTKGSRDSSD